MSPAPSEALVSKLHALEALLSHTCGDALEPFLNLKAELIDSYLACCAELATECKGIALQLDGQADAARPTQQEARP